MPDEKISRMTEMLLGGGKMLGIHCGNCKSPLFEFKGKIICPVCGAVERKAVEKAGERRGAPAEKGSLEKLEEALYSKLDSLGEQLKRETDQAKSLELLNSVKATLEALERLKK